MSAHIGSVSVGPVVSTTVEGLVTETSVTAEIQLTETLVARVTVETALQEQEEGDGVVASVRVELPAPEGIASVLRFRGRVRVCGEDVSGAWGYAADGCRYRDTWGDTGSGLDARSWPTHAQAREGGLAVGRAEVMLLVQALRARAEAHARVGS